MKNRKDIYTHRIEIYSDEFNRKKSQLVYLSVSRFAAFLLTGFGIFYLPRFSITGAVAVSTIFFITFLTLVKIYAAISRKKEHLSRLIAINENEIKALNFEFSQFDDGAAFINHDHPFTYDLDIFGPDSIYQFLNRSASLIGKQTLAQWLSNPLTDEKSILLKQEAIKELASKTDCRQNFQASGQIYSEEEKDIESVHLWLSEPVHYLGRKIYPALCFIAPVMSAVLIILTAINLKYFSLLAYSFLAQLFLIGTHLKINNKIHDIIGTKLNLLKKFSMLFSYIEENDFISEELVSLKHKLQPDNNPAQKVIKNLSSLVSAFDNRLNLFAGVLLNGFVLWDIQCVLRLEKWKSKNKFNIEKWFDVLGEFDAYCSLSNFAFNNPEYCYGLPVKEPVIKITDTGHPLIRSSERVDNDILIESAGIFIIITGANMAGKSTFLRTVAINLLMAMIGAPSCAREMQFKPSKLFTSMRSSDNLLKNESYFYAELKRLKELLELLRQNNEVFIILDEILKGTNSIDKQRGSKAVLKEIIRLKGTGLIATHDLELASLEDVYPDNIRNKCFEIEIKGSEILFDYKLYDGITKKMNASLLMRQMGIVGEEI